MHGRVNNLIPHGLKESMMMSGGWLTNWLCPPNRAYMIKSIVADCEITMRVDKVGKEEVQLTHGYVDVVGVDAESRMQTIRGLL